MEKWDEGQQTQPHSVQAEYAVLGSMLMESSCIPKVVAQLKPEDFYLSQNREMYQVLFDMFNHFEVVDLITMPQKVSRALGYEEADVYRYLSQLMETSPDVENIQTYVDMVLDNALLRRVAEVGAELERMARHPTGTAQQILEVAEQRIFAVRQGRSARDMAHIATVMSQVWETIKERQERGTEFPGISTGLIDLDRRISGLNNSDLLILAARPGMGKTSLALNIGLEAGKHSGKSVAIFSLEMSREQLGLRLISTECLIDNKKLLTGRIVGEEEWSRLAMAVATLSQANIYIDDDSSLSVADMHAKCRRIKDLGLVIVDYLQLMTSAGGPVRASDNRQQIVSDISRSMKLMAKDLDVPVICLSQLSRANESRAAGQRRPMLSDLRESGSIEQDADIVMFIYRESYYEDDTENPNVAECIVAKNRHGETGTVMLEWRPEFTTFRNLAYNYDEEDY